MKDFGARCTRETIYAGRRGLGIHAMAAVDLALWDIAGQAQRRPVFELLGGPVRNSVVPYASVHPAIASLTETERRIQEIMVKVVEMRYRAVKL